MKTHTKECGDGAGASRKRECVPCEITAPCRNHYYRGKLLTERDFSREQQYFLDQARVHQRALHGWGIVCGLTVEPHPHCPELRVVVSPGLAVDDCGRSIRVCEPVQVVLPKAPPKRPEPPCPEEPGPGGPPDQHDQGPPGHATPEDPDDETHPDPYNPCDEEPPPKDLYLCLRYTECETEFQPAPFDDCGCNTDGQQPNRVCEGFEVTLLEDKPGWWDDALAVDCKLPDCEDLFRRAQRHCPEFGHYPCQPLAILRNVEAGKPVTVRQVENWHRRTLSSTSTLEEVVRCILDKLPTKEITRIIDISWEHGERVLCHQFMSEFVGSPKDPRGFHIRFDSKVLAQSIDTRSFQALVVFRPDEMSEPRHMEVAPAVVDRDEYETDWCRLRIDPGYAHRRLDGRNFDLFVTLKCDVITGKNGLAVDGNFLAVREPDDVWRMALPTGDNVAGGTFESWIRVRPRPKGQQEPRRSAS